MRGMRPCPPPVQRGSPVRTRAARLSSEQWPEKAGKGLMFISLNFEPATHEAEVAVCRAANV